MVVSFLWRVFCFIFFAEFAANQRKTTVKLKVLHTLLGIAAFALGGAANAMAILDQESSPPQDIDLGLSDGSGFGRAQTFTVGIAGILDSIDAAFVSTSSIPSPSTPSARIIATSGGTPIGGAGGSTVLAESSVVSNVGDVFTFDFSLASLAVSIGDIFAIELFGDYRWQAARGFTTDDFYTGGSAFLFNTDFGVSNWTESANTIDANFRTYVTTAVPAPPSIALLGLGLAGIGYSRKRFNQIERG